MRKVCLFIITTLVAVSTSWAQRHEILSPRIATLQVVVNDNWQSLPVMKLHSSDRLHIDFDDLTHEYSRYAYRLEQAVWTLSEENPLQLFNWLYAHRGMEHLSGILRGNIDSGVQHGGFMLHEAERISNPAVKANALQLLQ